ncbi:MAG: MBL fold metallo-hydrolase [Streptosporangiaceae bacterium]
MSGSVGTTTAVHAAKALGPTLVRVVRPRRPDPAFLAGLDPVTPPHARGGVSLRALPQNSFSAPTFAIAEGTWRPWLSPMTMGAFLVEHEQATFLVDAGVCHDTRQRHLSQLPAVTRALVVPDAYAGAALGPFDLNGPPVETFSASFDLFGDGTVVVVSLPGHTPGHVGVLVTLRSGRRCLLAGDAVWNSFQVRAALERAPLPGRLVDVDREETYASVVRLHRMSPDITVLPAHDKRAIDMVFAGGPLD